MGFIPRKSIDHLFRFLGYKIERIKSGDDSNLYKKYPKESLLNKKFLFASQSIFAKAQNICHDSKIQGMELYFQDEFNDGSILTRALSLT